MFELLLHLIFDIWFNFQFDLLSNLVSTAGRTSHEDGHRPGVNGVRVVRHRSQDGLLRRSHPSRLRLQAKVGRRRSFGHPHPQAKERGESPQEVRRDEPAFAGPL